MSMLSGGYLHNIFSYIDVVDLNEELKAFLCCPREDMAVSHCSSTSFCSALSYVLVNEIKLSAVSSFQSYIAVTCVTAGLAFFFFNKYTYPERLLNFHPYRFSGPAWIKPSVLFV